MKGFDLFFIPKPFGNSTSWQEIRRKNGKTISEPSLGSPYPITKASCQVLPGGLEKIPYILGIFFLDILLPLPYIQLIPK